MSLFFKFPAKYPDIQLFASNAARTLYTSWVSVSRKDGINAMIDVSLMDCNKNLCCILKNKLPQFEYFHKLPLSSSTSHVENALTLEVLAKN